MKKIPDPYPTRKFLGAALPDPTRTRTFKLDQIQNVKSVSKMTFLV